MIRPEHINTGTNERGEPVHFWNAFGNCETEISAKWLVMFAQDRGMGWEPFTYGDIEEFYRRKSCNRFRGFSFNLLISGNWIISNSKDKRGRLGSNTILEFTYNFIAQCHAASPVT